MYRLGSTPAADAPAVADRNITAATQPAGWRGFWTGRRARLWLSAAIAASWLPILGVPFRRWLDFSAFYTAANLLFTPAVAQLEPVVTFEREHGLAITPFVYPPGVALFYAPLARLPFDSAAALHLALQFAALVLAASIGGPALGVPRRWAVTGTLAWAPCAAGVLSGQNTAVALLLVAIGLVAGQRSAQAALGLDVGALLYKPQLGLPLVGLLAWRGASRPFAIASLVGVGWYLAGILATGGNAAWPADWLATLAAYLRSDLAANGWQAVSLPVLLARLYDALGLSGAGGSVLPDLSVLELVGYGIGAGLVVVALPSLRRWPWERAVAIGSAIGLFASPHAWVYDATLLLPALAVVAADADRLGWRWQDRWLVAGTYLLAAAWPAGVVLPLTPAALPVLAGPWVLIRRRWPHSTAETDLATR